MELEVINIKGEKTGRKVTLSDEIFGIEPNDHVIYLDVKRYLNAQRQGTHKAKERSEMTGSTKKLIKQKGGGGARRGDINSPLLRGGGRVFGPKPRDYDIKLNKKVKQAARRSALAYKARNNELLIVESFEMAEPKTKVYSAILDALNIGGKKSLLVTSEKNENLLKSARNLPQAHVLTVNDVNTYELMNATTVIFVEDAINQLTEKLK